MRRIFLPLGIVAALVACFAHATPAQAQASRTWVSGVGDDANPCSRTAPCKTFAGAISKTALNGEINCLDPGGFGTLTITKSITIDCHSTFASIANSGTNGINIPFDSFGTTGESRYTVRIRGLNFNGTNTGVIGIWITGGAVHAGGVVLIEDVLIDGNFGGSGRGISDDRTGGGELYISNTTVRNTANTGIVISGSGLASQRIDSTLQNVRVQNSGFGVAVSNAAMVLIDNSTFTGNSNAGIFAAGPINASQLNVNNSAMSNNGTGVENDGGATVQLSNNDITFNTIGFKGTTQSFTNNRIAANPTVGPVPTQILPLSTIPSGQQ
jgi:hypothetical protein